ncbi:MAG: flagellin, partial [Candidatus Bathyarchaeota archaeon B24]
MISTIIIVAVAIAISIAVAFWLGGITAIFTRFEKLEITSAYATLSDTLNWTVHISVKNTGTTDATITDILVNNIPYSEYGSQINITQNSPPITLRAGDEITIIMQVANASVVTSPPSTEYLFVPGQSITITIHTAG